MTDWTKNDVIMWLVAVGLVACVAIMLLGCAPIAPRYTTETYWPGDTSLIVVEWPEGRTTLDEIEVYEVDGRLQIVGPYRPETVY